MTDTPTGSAPRPDGMPGEPWHPELEPFTDQRPQGPDAAALVAVSDSESAQAIVDTLGGYDGHWQSGYVSPTAAVGASSAASKRAVGKKRTKPEQTLETQTEAY